MEENIELNKIEESKDLTQPEQEIKQKEFEGDPIAPKSAGAPTGKIIQFRKGTKAAYSSSSNIDTNTISVVSNADGTSTGKFSEIFLGDDMIGCGHNFTKYTSSSNPGRAGLVPAPGSGDTNKFLSVNGWADLPSAGYWANLAVGSAAAYNTAPEIQKVTINGNASAAQASTDHCVLVYDTTNKCLKFTF